MKYKKMSKILIKIRKKINKVEKKIPLNMDMSVMKTYDNIMDVTVITRVTRRVPLVEQELLTLQEHWSSPWFLVGFMLLDRRFCV
jgi:hypothetical protein